MRRNGMRRKQISMGWTYRGLQRCRPGLLPAVDALTWAVLLYLVSLLRFDLQTPQIRIGPFAVTVVIAMVCQVALGYITAFYRIRWKVGSFEQALALAWTVAGTTGVLLAYDIGIHRRAVPISAVVVSGAGVFIIAAGYRAAWRMSWEHRTRPAAAQPAGKYYPAALLDDDPEKQNLRIRHLRVAGRGTDLGRVATATGATVVIIAIPSAGSEFIREATQRADRKSTR